MINGIEKSNETKTTFLQQSRTGGHTSLAINEFFIFELKSIQLGKNRLLKLIRLISKATHLEKLCIQFNQVTN